MQNSKNGPFDAVLLLGRHNFSKLSVKPDAPTYFLGTEPSNTFKDVSENLTQVSGPWAELKLANGLRVGFASENPGDKPLSPVDILVTGPWPQAIARTQLLALAGDSYVDKIVAEVTPRYHFATGPTEGKFFENEPLKLSEDAQYRLISLAQEGQGQKWFYAFGIEPMVELQISPSFKQVFAKPEQPSLKRPAEEAVEIVQKKPKVVTPQDCFFCLSNPNLESHMVVAIGTQSYLAVAKGPMPLPQRPLDISGHAIIIPIDHVPTLQPELEQRQEMDKFLRSLAEAFLSQKFAMVSFEISRPDNVHIHIQLMPVPLENVNATFDRALEERTRQNNQRAERNQELHFTDHQEEVEKITKSGNFIRFIVFGEQEPRSVVAQLDPEKPVDLQFPRRVLAFHLKCPKRTYWNRCTQTKGQESGECDRFKRFFQNHDFTR